MLKIDISHTIHGWYIFTYRLLTFMVNVGKYTIHGCYGYIPIVDFGSFFPIAMNYISGFTELFEKIARISSGEHAAQK